MLEPSLCYAESVFLPGKPPDSGCSQLTLPSSQSPLTSLCSSNSAAPAWPSKGAQKKGVQEKMDKELHGGRGFLQTAFLTELSPCCCPWGELPVTRLGHSDKSRCSPATTEFPGRWHCQAKQHWRLSCSRTVSPDSCPDRTLASTPRLKSEELLPGSPEGLQF